MLMKLDKVLCRMFLFPVFGLVRARPRHKYPEKCSKNLSGNSQFFP